MKRADLLGFLLPPSFENTEKNRAAKFLNSFAWSLLAIAIVLVVIHLAGGSGFFAVPILILDGVIVLQVAILLLLHGGSVRLASLLLVFGGWMLMTIQAGFTDGVRSIALVVHVIGIIFAGILLGWRTGFVLTLMSIVSVWGLAFLEDYNSIVAGAGNPFDYARDLTFVFVSVAASIYFLVTSMRETLEQSRFEVSVRKQVEEALRQGEERFRKVFENSPVAICITRLEDGKLLDANQAYWHLTGFRAEEAIGRTADELELWDTELERLRFIDDLVDKQSLHNPSYEFVNILGEFRTTQAFYELIQIGSEPHVLSMFYDITEQKQTQVALEESESKYRNFIEQSIEGIWLLEFENPISTELPPKEQVRLIQRTGIITECNDALARMYGYPDSEALRGTKLWDLYGGNPSNVNFQSTLQLVKSGYRSANRETHEVSRDGSPVYFLNNAVGNIMNGYLVGVWGTQRDITELKEAEESLRRSEGRIRALLEAIPDMIFEFSKDGAIIQFIPSSDMQPLVTPEEFLGENIRDFLPPDVTDPTFIALENAFETGEMQTFEYSLSGDSGVREYEARIVPTEEDTALAMVREITLRKWAEAERENLISELETKNSELERFTYTVSHDLKAPLITIKGFLGFLEQDIKTGNEARLQSDIQRIKEATEKMQALLTDLLELSRIGRLMNPPEEFRFRELVDEVLKVLEGRISQQNLQVHIDPELPVVYADRQRIFEVLQNLVENAIKFTMFQSQPRIEIGQQGYTEAGMPVLYVRDNGIGIDPQYSDRIFGLFNKLDPASEGTGVGLALVKRIVEVHGGKVWVESSPGRGAAFFFSLPRKPA